VELERHFQRALEQGAHAAWAEKMRAERPAWLGSCVSRSPGPTVALRVDMDANDLIEAAEEKHRPFREGFASVNKGAMHACGHDGHTATGLGVAEVLAGLKDRLAGTVKLIFQPAEEGVRGAKAMVARGVVDDVKYVVGAHLGINLKKTGQVACRTEGFLATTKLDAVFTGKPAHAGGAPEQGRNAVLAAATATLNLHAISRHSQGASRINVGVIQGGPVVTSSQPRPSSKWRPAAPRAPSTTTCMGRRFGSSRQRPPCMVVPWRCSSWVGHRLRERRGARDQDRAGRETSGALQRDSSGREHRRQRGLFLFHGAGSAEGRAGRVRHDRNHMTAGHHDGFFDIDENALVPGIALLAGVAADLLSKGRSVKGEM